MLGKSDGATGSASKVAGDSGLALTIGSTRCVVLKSSILGRLGPRCPHGNFGLICASSAHVSGRHHTFVILDSD
ncbi:hypothetical protein ACOSP7_001219 [Xanthoceras sorbifolium]